MVVPKWLVPSIVGALFTAMLTIIGLVVSNSKTNVGQDEKIAQIERRQVTAQGIVDRVDAQLAQLRERLARLEAQKP